MLKNVKIYTENKMKKLISFALALIVLVCSLGVFSSAVSIKKGVDALQNEFQKGVGPKTGAYTIDYRYFSPQKSEKDKTKYPLVVILHGYTEGTYEGEQIYENDFARWACDEYQKRFANSGGAYIMIARAPEEKMVAWNTAALVEPLKAAIDDFVKSNENNIDTSRIYIMGWSLGATDAVRIAAKYPDYFAALIYIAADRKITEAQAKKLKNTAVWIMHCTTDSYAIYSNTAKPSWENIKKNTNVPSKVRITTYKDALTINGFINHNVWEPLMYDMEYKGSGYSDMKTVDANGKTVSNSESFIKWLSKQKVTQTKEEKTETVSQTQEQTQNVETAESESCSCLCHTQDFYAHLVWEIYKSMWRVKCMSEYKGCSCGKTHWK